MIKQSKLSRICTGGLLAAAALFGTASLAMAQTVELIQNRWTPSQYITMQGNQPVAGPASTTAPSAQWSVEQTGEANVVRLRNVATGTYLVSRTGQLTSSPDAAAEMVGASWTLERLPGNPDVRIRSNESGAYLHTKDGPLMLGDASPTWQQSFWKFVPAGQAQRAPAVVPIAAPPPPRSGCIASNGRWLWIDGKYVCAHHCPSGTHRVANSCVPNHHHCPPGFHHVGKVCVKDCKPGFHPVGNICVPNKKPLVCGPGKHPVGNICVPDKKPLVCGPGKHPVGNVCVPDKKPLPKLCPSGQHISKGHCCPNGKSWNNAQKKCA